MHKQSHIFPNGDSIDLVQLDRSWLPWTFQINYTVADGHAYQRPGKPTRTSMANYRTEATALAAWVKQVAHGA